MSTTAARPRAEPQGGRGDVVRGRTSRLALAASVVALVLLTAASAATASLDPRADTAALALSGLAAAVAAAYVAWTCSPAALLAAAVCLQVFSSNWSALGLPLGLDRLMLAAALAAFVRELAAGRMHFDQRWSTVHSVLLALATFATISAAAAGTLWTTKGAFALLDRLGLVPFLCYALAPLLFRTPGQRNVLLGAFVALGGYLGITALAEGAGVDALVFPRYILDPAVGIHPERARGPFVEGVANGLGLYSCAVIAYVASRTWRNPFARAAAALVCVLCLVGTVFTLTRAVWLATVLGTFAAMLSQPELRRKLPAVLAGGVAAVLLVLVAVPGFASLATSRTNDQRPIWDRYNANVAAVRIVEERALTGIGWQRFTEDGPDWLRQAGDYPITGVGIEVHNVFLSHFAEMGVLGGSLFVLAFVLGVGRAVLGPCPPEWVVYRSSMIAIATGWLVVASFGPLSYAFPNSVLWLWAGLVASRHGRDGERLAPPDVASRTDAGSIAVGGRSAPPSLSRRRTDVAPTLQEHR